MLASRLKIAAGLLLAAVFSHPADVRAEETGGGVLAVEITSANDPTRPRHQ